MTEKPSRNEEEYFAKAEARRVEAMREAARAEAVAAERRTHIMKCPRDGGDLVVEDFHGIEVERCPECKGLWFDREEADALIKASEGSGLSGMLRSILEGVRGPRRETPSRG